MSEHHSVLGKAAQTTKSRVDYGADTSSALTLVQMGGLGSRNLIKADHGTFPTS